MAKNSQIGSAGSVLLGMKTKRYQWALSYEHRSWTDPSTWEHVETQYFATKRAALRRFAFEQDADAASVRSLSWSHERIEGASRFVLAKVYAPWTTCPVCGAESLHFAEDRHRFVRGRCRSDREPLAGAWVRVRRADDGSHVGYGRVAKRDGYGVFWVRLNGGAQVPVGDAEFELVLPGLVALGITCLRVGEEWHDYVA